MSVTVTIPGGTAELFEKKELTPRRQLPIKSLLARSGNLLFKLTTARRVVGLDGEVDERPELSGEDLILTEHEADIQERINYATIWAYLKSWTLDIPLPTSADAFLDVPAEIVDALGEAVARVAVDRSAAADAEIAPGTLEDKASFTGSSEGTATT